MKTERKWMAKCMQTSRKMDSQAREKDGQMETVRLTDQQFSILGSV